MEERQIRAGSGSADRSAAERRKRRRERERHRRLRRLGIVIGGVLCGVIALVLLHPGREPAPAETMPPQPSTQAPDSTTPGTTIPENPSPETTVPETTPAPQETTAPAPETTTPPPETTAPSILASDAYQKLLTLPNAEAFLCNEFGYNYLEIFALWIESQDGLMESYPEEWQLKGYADGAAGLTCYSPPAEDNSRNYYHIQILDYNDIFPYPETGTRYFTDIPREDVAALVYGAADPIGVEEHIKEAFIDYILYSDWFAWSVLEPEFRTEWYYEIATICPDPELEPENRYEQLRLCVTVWRPGMAEEEPFRCWLSYDPEWMQAGAGYEQYQLVLRHPDAE